MRRRERRKQLAMVLSGLSRLEWLAAQQIRRDHWINKASETLDADYEAIIECQDAFDAVMPGGRAIEI